MSTAVCRVCLAGGDVRMHRIEDIQLLEVYEKLSDTKWNAGSERPSTMCFICYQQLKRCRMFSETAHRAERILQVLARGTLTIHDAITAQNLRIPRHLSVFSAQQLSIDDSAEGSDQCPQSTDTECNYSWTWDTPFVTVKEEHVAVKEEKSIKPDIFKEIQESAPDIEEHSNRSDDKTSSESLKVPCEQCDKKFKNSRYLKAHMITHTGQKPFSCDTCGKSFSQLSYFKLHVKTHTEGKPHACTSCAKTFYRKGNLNKHMQTHSQEKSYACDTCGKRFKQSSHLKVHARIHTGEKSFACEICGKTFNQIANLNKHIGIHSGVKPFSCDICGKAFLQRAQVKAHMRSHTGEKPYACARCGAAFSHASPLRRHARLHTEAEPYACARAGCYASFGSEGALAAHARAHAELARAHACARCGKGFADARGLTRHGRQVHGSTPARGAAPPSSARSTSPPTCAPRTVGPVAHRPRLECYQFKRSSLNCIQYQKEKKQW